MVLAVPGARLVTSYWPLVAAALGTSLGSTTAVGISFFLFKLRKSRFRLMKFRTCIDGRGQGTPCPSNSDGQADIVPFKFNQTVTVIIEWLGSGMTAGVSDITISFPSITLTQAELGLSCPAK